MPCVLDCLSYPSQNTYTVPALSVRTVQPLAPLTRKKGRPDVDPGMFCRVWVLQVSPPSADVARSSVWAFDPALGPPTYLAKHTYALPKKSLVSALSAQICSLSANPAALWLPVITTGRIQASFPAAPPAAAAAASSVRETPIASTPLNVDKRRLAEKFSVRLA